MHRFRFHFNTQYALELREAINDRQKQSMVNIHKDRQIKGDYFAWDRTCAAMDRLEDTLEYFNNIELDNWSSVRTAFNFYDFINNSYGEAPRWCVLTKTTVSPASSCKSARHSGVDCSSLESR